MTTSSPSAFILSMPCRMPSAADFDFSSLWRSSVATTSSGVTVLPSWNSMPLRIFIVQVLASAEAPMSSAMRFSRLPSGFSSTSISPQHLPKLKLTWERLSAGSSTLEDSPPCRPAFSWPPLTGVCAKALSASVPASAAETPRAAARPRKSRRESLPLPASLARWSSSVVMSCSPVYPLVALLVQFPALCMRLPAMAFSSQPISISGTEESKRSV